MKKFWTPTRSEREEIALGVVNEAFTYTKEESDLEWENYGEVPPVYDEHEHMQYTKVDQANMEEKSGDPETRPNNDPKKSSRDNDTVESNEPEEQYSRQNTQRRELAQNNQRQDHYRQNHDRQDHYRRDHYRRDRRQDGHKDIQRDTTRRQYVASLATQDRRGGRRHEDPPQSYRSPTPSCRDPHCPYQPPRTHQNLIHHQFRLPRPSLRGSTISTSFQASSPSSLAYKQWPPSPSLSSFARSSPYPPPLSSPYPVVTLPSSSNLTLFQRLRGQSSTLPTKEPFYLGSIKRPTSSCSSCSCSSYSSCSSCSTSVDLPRLPYPYQRPPPSWRPRCDLTCCILSSVVAVSLAALAALLLYLALFTPLMGDHTDN